jgi:hypothetical protein
MSKRQSKARKKHKNRQWERLEKQSRKALLTNALLIEATHRGTPGSKIKYKAKGKRP